MAWKKGPLPAETWNFGGVVPVGQSGGGFYYADFFGDHVIISPDGKVLQAHEVAWYDNSLEIPPGCTCRAK